MLGSLDGKKSTQVVMDGRLANWLRKHIQPFLAMISLIEHDDNHLIQVFLPNIPVVAKITH